MGKFKTYILEESIPSIKLKDLPELKDFRDSDYLAGEIGDYIQYTFIKQNFPKDIIQKSATPDRGGNHGKSGYFIFKTPSNEYTLKIKDFSNLKDVVKTVNDFSKKYFKAIHQDIEDANISIDNKFIKKLLGVSDISKIMKQKLFAGTSSVEISLVELYRIKYSKLPNMLIDWPAEIIEKMKKEGTVYVQKLQKKYPNQKIFLGVGNIINVEHK